MLELICKATYEKDLIGSKKYQYIFVQYNIHVTFIKFLTYNLYKLLSLIT